MKQKQFFMSALCLLAMGGGFVACDDDDDNNSWNNGAVVALPEHRIFVLNEGSYGQNNATLAFHNPQTGETIGDIYYVQNDAKLGDTAQDMIEYDGDIYIVMNGSNYIVRLNGAGVEQARYSFTEEQGQPRYATAEDGKVYVTLYSGHVARLNAKTLEFEKMVAVGNNPEQIVEEDDVLYCVNSGWGYDNRLSIIDARTFETATHVEVMTNPQRLIECGDLLFIQGYGAAYPDPYTYPVVRYNPINGDTLTIGQGTHMAAYESTLYVAYCYSPDWVNYTTSYYTYNVRTGEKKPLTLTNAPEAVTTGNVYMLEVNPENGDIYVGITHYTSGNGDIYRFDADGNYVSTFESGGQNPNGMVFMD